MITIIASTNRENSFTYKVANHYTTMYKTKGFIQKVLKYCKISVYVFYIYFDEIKKKLKYN